MFKGYNKHLAQSMGGGGGLWYPGGAGGLHNPPLGKTE